MVGLRSYVWKGLSRRPFRNMTVVLCFAFIAGSVLSADFLVSGTDNSIQTGMDRLGADLLVVPARYQSQSESAILIGQPSSFRFSSDVFGKVAAVDGVAKACPKIFIATLSNQACCSEPVLLIGFNQSLDFTVQPWLDSQLGRPLEQDEILVGAWIIGDIGSPLIFYGHEFTIAGRLEETGMGMDCSIFIRDLDAYVMAAESSVKAAETISIPNGTVSTILVKLEPGTNSLATAMQIRALAPQVSVLNADGLTKTVSNQVSGATQPLLLSSLIVAVASVPLMAAITAMTVNERRSEIGVLRTLGATKRFVFLIVMADTLLLAAIGSIIGSSVAALLLYGFQPAIAAQLGIPFLWPSPMSSVILAGSVCVLAMAIAAVSALYPASKASRIDPYEAIRDNET
jgi:putative ABC transport system permease protein